MSTKVVDEPDRSDDRTALLEKALIEAYLHENGYSLEALKELPAELVEKLMKEASQYASLKMEEVTARAHFIEELRDDASPIK